MSAVLAEEKLFSIFGIATLVIERSSPITKFVKQVATKILQAAEDTLASSLERFEEVTTLIVVSYRELMTNSGHQVLCAQTANL